MSIGIMQGRLTPPKGRGIQFFPFDNWENEFYRAEKIGLEEIEWIFDFYEYKKNPLWTEEGRKRINDVIKDTNVVVNTICWDYFMRRPFFKYNSGEVGCVLEENKAIFEKILVGMQEIGASLIEIPLVDDSSISDEKEEIKVINFLREMCDLANSCSIKIGLETDYSPEEFRPLIDKIERDNLVANYDSGNSSGLGYNHKKEILALGNKLYNVHIKDRVYQGTTVKLGTGSADFDGVFSALKKIGYQNSFILQAARGEEGKEKDNIMQQLFLVKEYIKKYQL